MILTRIELAGGNGTAVFCVGITKADHREMRHGEAKDLHLADVGGPAVDLIVYLGETDEAIIAAFGRESGMPVMADTSVENPSVLWTIELIRERLARIRAIAAGEIDTPSDDALAHAEEDELYRAVLSAIAVGAPNASALARTALESRLIDFCRWYE